MRLARCPRLLLGAGVSAVGIILILTIRLRPRRHESLRYWDD
jgi:hypothetical protein